MKRALPRLSRCHSRFPISGYITDYLNFKFSYNDLKIRSTFNRVDIVLLFLYQLEVSAIFFFLATSTQSDDRVVKSAILPGKPQATTRRVFGLLFLMNAMLKY